MKSFQDLAVWQKSMQLVKEIYLITQQFPSDEKFGIVSQIRRAAISVPSNIAEGWGRNSSGNYIHFLKIANGSLCEVQTQLILCTMLSLVPEESILETKKLIEDTGKMLRALIKSIENNKKN
ncbi:MAG: four helix bundle protein [Crocinitomicaceae bacterium]|nr:four helix bundle protein [Crocinitomicaceae bacterium]